MVFLKVLTIAAIAAVGMLASVGTQLTYGLGSINSQGVQAHQSDPWNQAGFSGEGIKVGIIENSGEGGFFGYQQLMGTELPTSVAARCYTRIGQFVSDIGICDTGGDHGTNVAETVADIAPEVSLYIANPGTAADLRSTVNWMVSEGVSVINHSAVWAFDGPPDGIWDYNFSIGNSVKRAMDAGIVWVNSAGNDARRTWFGPTTFTDGGEHFEFLEFQSNDIFNDMAMETGDRVWINLRWDDNWAGARRELDLSLWSHSEEEIVAASLDYQNGLPGEFPIERLSFTAPRQGVYGIVVSISVEDAPDKPNWAQLIVSSHDISEIESFTLAGSIRNPAELSDPRMMAVGASHWADTHVLEPYSSRGPTPDGRTKPEIVGVACGETSRTPLDVAGRGFCGTSQASPHVAGMAALVRQRFPDFTPVEVANYLKENAEQRDSPDPNNVWGYGFAKLPPVDRAALEVLYNATGGDNWLENANWMTSGALSTWHGVTTDSQGRVTVLNLTRNQLKGELPPELANLTNLQVLALGGNQLTGKIPAWLGGLTNLKELYLGGNQLTGEIPAELGNLTHLYLYDNQLTGEIPAELGGLTNLTHLSLHSNQLTGEIPAELGGLTNLAQLSLHSNQLTGEIPVELGGLSNLTHLYLFSNQLTGEIPAELGGLTNLAQLYLYDNQLTGEIPAELGGLTNVAQLSLHSNQLTGEIPAELGGLANLTQLFLFNNQLTGEIPAELGSLTYLLHLDLSDNLLTGEIPAELGSLAGLGVLFLGGNGFTGCIPNGLRGVGINDLSQLGLPFCDMPGAPTIATQIVPGDASLTVAWAAPINTGSSAITAYDLRYIETGAADKSDANWTVVEDVWAAGSGSLQYTLSGLTGGTQYDVQVRAVNAAGASAWSATVTGTTTSAVVGTAPVFSDSEGNPITEAVRSVVENTAAGENVGAPVTAMDADNDTLTYSLGGTDMASFDIDPSTGQIMVGAGTMLDYETKASYMVTVTATDPDSASDMITVPIAVTNEEETGEVTLWAGMDALTMAPQVGDTITGAVMDPDGGVTGETWQWSRTMDDMDSRDMDSRDMDSWVDIEDATDDEYTVMEGDTGYYLRVMATYTDAVGTDTAMEYSMPTIMVTAEDLGTLGSRYDTDNNRLIDKEEAIAAVRDYFDDRLTKEETIEIIRLYFTSSS